MYKTCGLPTPHLQSSTQGSGSTHTHHPWEEQPALQSLHGPSWAVTGLLCSCTLHSQLVTAAWGFGEPNKNSEVLRQTRQLLSTSCTCWSGTCAPKRKPLQPAMDPVGSCFSSAGQKNPIWDCSCLVPLLHPSAF